MLAVAGVERVGQHLDLEQVKRDAAHVLPPDVGGDDAVAELDLDRDGLATEAGCLGVEALVRLRLPAGIVDPLPEVAAAVEQADADERDAELGRRLQVVAGEHAEPARVDRQLWLDPELHREVGDERAGGVGPMVVAPPGGCRVGRGHGRLREATDETCALAPG